jgi:ADP-heptose:LPS heptosyltransferase
MFKIAIFRALQLGDLLCSIPAITALKFNYPNAKLYFIGLPHMRALMDRFDCIDEYIDFPGHPALPEIPYDTKELARFSTADASRKVRFTCSDARGRDHRK